MQVKGSRLLKSKNTSQFKKRDINNLVYAIAQVAVEFGIYCVSNAGWKLDKSAGLPALLEKTIQLHINPIYSSLARRDIVIYITHATKQNTQ